MTKGPTSPSSPGAASATQPDPRRLAQILAHEPGLAPQVLPESARAASRRIQDATLRAARELLRQSILRGAAEGILAVEQLEVTPAEILEELRALFSGEEAAQGRRLRVSPCAPASFLTDPTLLLQALSELVMNALEASPEGGVIKLWHDRTGDRCAFGVRHEGVMPSWIQANLDRPGFSTKGEHSGHGLRLVRLVGEGLLGGSLQWTSSEQDGTRFVLTLPALRSDQGIRSLQDEEPAWPGSGDRASTVLLVDDSRIVLHLLETILEPEYRVLRAQSGQEALAVALERQPDLILLDVVMPGMDGFEVLSHLRAEPRTEDIPVIFLTALSGEAGEVRGLTSGAVDFITKPIHPAAVRARVRTHVELKVARDRLRDLSLKDGLTGIANRRRFDLALEREWFRALRYGRPLSLIMADIDFFKAFNDHHGHPAGDACLQAVAGALSRASLRASDVVARYGGEEFVALLPETDHAGALAVAERIQAEVAALGLAHGFSEACGQVTLSMGVATRVPEREGHPEDLLESADARLYAAKWSGRNRIEG